MTDEAMIALIQFSNRVNAEMASLKVTCDVQVHRETEETSLMFNLGYAVALNKEYLTGLDRDAFTYVLASEATKAYTEMAKKLQDDVSRLKFVKEFLERRNATANNGEVDDRPGHGVGGIDCDARYGRTVSIQDERAKRGEGHGSDK